MKFIESELVDELFADDDTVNEFIWDCISIEFIDIFVFFVEVLFELDWIFILFSFSFE